MTVENRDLLKCFKIQSLKILATEKFNNRGLSGPRAVISFRVSQTIFRDLLRLNYV
jgi:hypothetical protein